MDKYETVPYDGGDRPEYVLKNGKVINVYGLLEDVRALQAQLAESEQIRADQRSQNLTLLSVVAELEDNAKGLQQERDQLQEKLACAIQHMDFIAGLSEIMRGEFGDRVGDFFSRYADYRPNELRKQAKEDK